MWSWDFNIYLGDNSETEHIGFATDTQLFLIAQADGLDESAFHEAVEVLKQYIISHKPDSLQTLQASLDGGMGELSGKLSALCVAWVVKNVTYFITKGDGEIYISRAGKTAKLIEGDSSASGYIEDNDYFVLTNKSFTAVVNDVRLKTLLKDNTPQENIEILTPELKATNDVGMFALFVKVSAEEQDDEASEDEGEKDSEEIPAPNVSEELPDNEESDKPQAYKPATVGATGSAYAQNTPVTDAYGQEMSGDVHNYGMSQPIKSPRKFNISLSPWIERFQTGQTIWKKVTLVIVIVLLCVLGWSVFSGNARRQREKFIEKVQAESQVIERNLSEAGELVGTNTQRSLELIDSSKASLAVLQKEAAEKEIEDVPELADLVQKITDVENSIQKKEEAQSEEFYDLDLIEKGTTAKKLFLDDDKLALLDSDNDQVHILTIGEKSVESYASNKAKNADFIAIHQDVPYIAGDAIGVVRITSDGKGEEVIPADKDWGSLEDFWMYSGNMYLLDSAKNDVHKYLVAEEGYSEKRSYFGEGESPGLTSATAIAIDSSLYIANSDKAQKFSSGVRSPFEVSIPDASNINYEDVFTSSDVDSVYLLDTDSRRVFIVSKTGEFLKQISAGIIGKTDDFVVVEDLGILILADNKLYLLKE